MAARIVRYPAGEGETPAFEYRLTTADDPPPGRVRIRFALVHAADPASAASPNPLDVATADPEVAFAVALVRLDLHHRPLRGVLGADDPGATDATGTTNV